MLSPDCEECASSRDHREALAGELADLVGDDRELLQRGDDDRPTGFQGLAELARGVVDVLDHTEGLLELPDGLLELAIEHSPVGHHDHRVEDAPVVEVMQHRELVGRARRSCSSCRCRPNAGSGNARPGRGCARG